MKRGRNLERKMFNEHQSLRAGSLDALPLFLLVLNIYNKGVGIHGELPSKLE
jgi:hypothetical protein